MNICIRCAKVNSIANPTELYEGATGNATINESEGYISGINTTFIDSYITSTVNVTSIQNITEDFFVPGEVSIGETYFPLSMPFSFNRSYEYSLLPEALKYKVSLILTPWNTTENPYLTSLLFLSISEWSGEGNSDAV